MVVKNLTKIGILVAEHFDLRISKQTLQRLIGKYFYVVDFVVDFYGDPSETPSACVAVDATKGVPDGSRTT